MDNIVQYDLTRSVALFSILHQDVCIVNFKFPTYQGMSMNTQLSDGARSKERLVPQQNFWKGHISVSAGLVMVIDQAAFAKLLVPNHGGEVHVNNYWTQPYSFS